MIQLLAHLRTLQFYAHHAHNAVKGPLFLSDHSFLGEIYEAAASDYDAVAERFVKFKGCDALDQMFIIKQMYKDMKNLPMHGENKEFFTVILSLEEKTCSIISQIISSPEATEGIKQLLGEMCNQGEVRCYKIQQRIK